MELIVKPIGYVYTDADQIPINWETSEVEGKLVLDKKYQKGLSDIQKGQHIYLLYHIHKSLKFTDQHLRVVPPKMERKLGVFSTNSPIRPNPIGLSLVKVIRVEGNIIHIKGVDMLDQTPILDIKPEKPV